MITFSARTIIASLVAIIGAGTVFFRFIEGWSWLDSYFFTVVTLSTVGYGSLVPQTAIGKIGTTLFIFVGIGVFALAIQKFADYHLHRRETRSSDADDDQNGKNPSSRS